MMDSTNSNAADTAAVMNELQRIATMLGYSHSVVEQAFAQYSDYLKKTKFFVSREKVGIVLRVAILMAAKTQMQVIQPAEQQQASGQYPRSSLEYVMHDMPERVDECVVLLKEWLTFASIHESTRLQLKTSVEDFSYMLAIFTKFDKVFRFFGFAEQNLQQKSYNKNLKHLSWLLLLIAKQRSEHQAIIETTLYIIAVFQFMLTSVARFTTATFIEENAGNEKQALLKHFHVFDVESYEAIAIKFVQSLKQIFEKEILVHEGDIFKIFSPGSIEDNIRNLSQFYKEQYMQDIDEEIFMTEKKPSSNPVNLTPFSRQGGHNKHAAPFPQEKYGAPFTNNSSNNIANNNASTTPSNKAIPQTRSGVQAGSTSSSTTFASQRLLNYGSDDINNENIRDQSINQVSANFSLNVTINSTTNSNSNSNYILNSTKKTTTIENGPLNGLTSPNQSMKNGGGMRGAATPITNAMEMYNWLNSRKNIISCSNGTIALELNKKVENLDDWLNTWILKIIDFEKQETAIQLNKPSYEMDQRTQESRISQISSLFYRVLHEYYQEEKQVNESIQKGILACACECVYFILNIRTLSFERVVDLIGISWFELWKIMDFFLRLDQTMPVSLKAHILDLEAKVVSYYAWREDSELLRFVRAYIVDSASAKTLLDDRQQGYAIEKFFRRVMHQCAYTIQQICGAVRLSDSISEGVWRLMKHILGNASELQVGRHLDQLILCSMYVMCKIFKSDTQFRTILNKYEELNSHNKSMMRELIYDLPISAEKRDNIVEYYNVCFLVPVKKTALLIGKALTSPTKSQQSQSQSSPQSKSQLQQQQGQAKNPALATPMFTSPLKAMFTSDVTKSMTKLPSHMTPQTHMLYAYSESPFLKDHSQAGIGMISSTAGTQGIGMISGSMSSKGFSAIGGATTNMMGNQSSQFRNLNSKKMINFDAADSHKPVVMTNASHSTTNASTASSNSSNNRIADKIPFAKYMKPKMDSILESHCEQSASNSIQNKFVKRVTDGCVKTEPSETDSSMNASSSNNNINNMSALTENHSSTIAGSNLSTTPRMAVFDSAASGGAAASFLKNFSKQSTYSQNISNPIMQSPSANMKAMMTNANSVGSRSLLLLTPNQQQSQYQSSQTQNGQAQSQQYASNSNQQQQQQNMQQQYPLTQIPMQKINSWQNQHNQFAMKLQDNNSIQQSHLQQQQQVSANSGIQQQQSSHQPKTAMSSIFDQFKKKV